MSEQTIQTVNAYKKWIESEGIPVVSGFHIENVNHLELGVWARTGGRGTYINIEGGGNLTDAFVCEIDPGGSLNPEKHMYEEVVYILRGSGASTVWIDAAKPQTFEWGEGSMFAIPLNAWHQHHNGSGFETVKFLSVTDAPKIINHYRNLDFIFDNPFVFRDRFSEEEDYWNTNGSVGRIGKRKIWEVNFVPDVRSIELAPRPDRGNVKRTHFTMAGSTMGVHVAEEPAYVYSKSHRHGSGVHIFTLAGRGYTLLWLEGQNKTRVEWMQGSLFAPPDRWFHQHFNTGGVPERSIRIGGTAKRYLVGPDTSNVPINKGGDQIEFEDEDPEIRRQFELEIARLCR